MNYFLSAILGYFVGNFSSSFLAGKLTKNIDIRQYGSGNAGATNTFRVLGSKIGFIVFIGDVLKGVIAALIGYWIAGESGAIISSLGAIIGHNWPVFLQFRGGKGIATSLGSLIVIIPLVSAIVFVIGIVIIVVTKYVSLASIIAAVLLPILTVVFKCSKGEIIYAIIVSVLALYRHKSNIKRLLSGTENKIDFSPKQKAK